MRALTRLHVPKPRTMARPAAGDEEEGAATHVGKMRPDEGEAGRR